MRRSWIPLAALAAVVAASAPSAADEPGGKHAAASSDEASRRFRAGVGFYKDGDFAAALVEFKRAYELDPNYRVLFNLGQTSQELNDYASALAAFRQYLQEGGSEIDRGRREKVEGFIDALKKKVGTIIIQTNVDGAEIFVDDAAVGKAPLDKPVLVNAGRRKLAASLSGYHPVVRQEEVAGLDEKTVQLELVKVETSEVPTRPVPTRRDERAPVAVNERAAPVAAWVMLSATGASAIATGVVGGLALSARSNLDAALGKFPGDANAIADAQSKVKTYALAADVLGAVTAACAVTTVVLFVVAPRRKDREPPKKAAVQVLPGGVVATGTF